jgi:hypothetical protein
MVNLLRQTAEKINPIASKLSKASEFLQPEQRYFAAFFAIL